MLWALAEGAGRVMSRDALMNRVRGVGLEAFDRSIDTHISNLRGKLERAGNHDADDESAHITGQELVEGIRDLALQQFGLLTRTVFERWGLRTTEDFGRIVFELIEDGRMRKTDRDRATHSG